MKIYVAHSSDFEYRTKLYEPLRSSSLNTEHEIFLPHDAFDDAMTKDYIRSCDVIVSEVSMPSTGAGIEMGWAHACDVPIICLYERGSKPSGAIKYVTSTIIEYETSDDLISKLSDALSHI